MIMRGSKKGERKGHAKVWSYPGMEKVVQQMRKKIDGVSGLFTLDACRHGGMTELEEAELPRSCALRTQDRAGLSRLRERNDAAGVRGDPQAACTSLGAEAARTTEYCWNGVSWRRTQG
jgi:hypothetical protein